MDSINKTLYIPLYGKSLVSKKGIILKDETAEYIFSRSGISLGRKSKNRFLAYFMAMRAWVFDNYVNTVLAAEKNVTVIHAGCGLDSRNIRVKAEEKDVMWYDVDFPAVTEERRKYYNESADYRMIPSDIRDKEWMENIPSARTAVLIMEGLSMYMPEEDLIKVINNISEKSGEIYVLTDVYSSLAAKLSGSGNPVSEVGVEKVYGTDNAKFLEEGTRLKFIKEHDMTPEHLIDELKSFERFIFKTLYAGKFAKSLYRIYEYRTER